MNANSFWTKCFAVTALALPLASGCVGGSNESSDQQGADLASENGNDKIAFDFFVGKGLSNVQAAGIVGNLDQESGMSPTIKQFGGGPGRGIAQWSAGGRWDTSRNDNVESYARQHGDNALSLPTQLDFIWYELTTFGYGFSRLKGATTVTEATLAFMDDYEICGACDSSNRIAHAEAALADFGHSSPPHGPIATPPKPAECGGWKPGQGLVAGESYKSCSGTYELSMQTDGNLVLYHSGKGAIWATGTNGKGGHTAIMQTDGNFVLYDDHASALWASHTNGHGGSDLAVQDDGNLVVYQGSKAVWDSHTNGK